MQIILDHETTPSTKTFILKVCQQLTDKLCIDFQQKSFNRTKKDNANCLIILVKPLDIAPFYHLNLIEQQVENRGIELNLNYDQGTLLFKMSNQHSKHRALHKALGLKANKAFSVIDACAGFGRDGLSLAASGAKVTMLENNPIIATIAQNALARALSNLNLDADTQAIFKRVNYLETNCTTHFQQLKLTDEIDAIYLDPMFPQKETQSKVKKESHFLRLLTTANQQKNNLIEQSWQVLLDAALHTPVKRIVLKRPNYAPPSSHPKPSGVIKGKTTRYEIYAGNQ